MPIRRRQGVGALQLRAVPLDQLKETKMSTGLVWRAVLFLGLTAGYAFIAALPYLA